jgi:hypothetical protein
MGKLVKMANSSPRETSANFIYTGITEMAEAEMDYVQEETKYIIRVEY